MQSKSDIDGTVGNNFLKRFNMIIDFKQKSYTSSQTITFGRRFTTFSWNSIPETTPPKPVSVTLSTVLRAPNHIFYSRARQS